MFEISEHIVVGETISHSADRILRGIRHPFFWKKGFWYAVTTSCGDDSLMYILSGRELKLKFYQNRGIRVLGLAGSMKEAYEIVLKLVQDGYNNNQIFKMKEYLREY